MKILKSGISNLFNRDRVTRTLLVLSMCAQATVSMAAEDLIEQWYMQPRLNLNTEASNFPHLNHQSISIGRALNKRIDLEINLLSDNLDYKTDNQSILIDGRYYLEPLGRFSPYLAGGISSPINNNRIDFAYQDSSTNLGLGFEHTLKGIGAKIQADIRYFVDDRQTSTLDNNKTNDWALSFGVSIPLTVDIFK